MRKNEIANTELIHDIQKDLLNQLDWSINIMYERFSFSEIYPKILTMGKHKKEKNVKAFNYNEQDLLTVEINKYFASFIGHLKKCCPKLTKKQILLCCLFLRFSPLTISLCMGYYNTDNVKANKNRIKKKMVELSYFDFLFDFIFKQNAIC